VNIAILNGWAASPRAWDLCAFAHLSQTRMFSYIDQLDGKAEDSIRSSREPVAVAAWSMGATFALDLAARMPGKIAGLVLAAATPRLSDDPASGWKGMSPRRIEALRKGLELTGGRGLGDAPPGRPEMFVLDSPGNLERGLEYLRTADVRGALDRIPRSMPVRLFQSEKDGIVRLSAAKFLAEKLPQAVLTVVPGSEHALPAVLHAEISRSMEELAATDGSARI